jgi:hypothetical protein
VTSTGVGDAGTALGLLGDSGGDVSIEHRVAGMAEAALQDRGIYLTSLSPAGTGGTPSQAVSGGHDSRITSPQVASDSAWPGRIERCGQR